MTTQASVDLRDLFVMPDVKSKHALLSMDDEVAANEIMSLEVARETFGGRGPQSDKDEEGRKTAIEMIRETRRCVIIGPPGSGKSTLLEWLQLQLANAEIEFPIGGAQAIPVLLRVRQIADPANMPTGRDIIAAATEGADRASQMSENWLHRQMAAGRVVLMLDGLDETDLFHRDTYILPWLRDLCQQYPDCHYIASSRPVGYPTGTLDKLEFAENHICDFTPSQIGDYTVHWCTAIRLGRNEPENEARQEGAREGLEILQSFEGNRYIADLVRNPLMLSAVCLVNYFEGGKLPEE